METMLVLLSHPEDIEGRLSEIRELASTHKVEKVCLISLSRSFGTRIRSIVAPHKLDMAAKMNDEAVNSYLTRIADELCKAGIVVEAVKPRIPVGEINRFIEESNIDLIVSTENFSALSSYKTRIATPPIFS